MSWCASKGAPGGGGDRRSRRSSKGASSRGGDSSNYISGDNRSELVVLKNRFNGQTGPAGKLSYGIETGRLTQALFDNDTPSSAPASYDDF